MLSIIVPCFSEGDLILTIVILLTPSGTHDKVLNLCGY